MTDSTAVAAPPTAQEALDSLDCLAEDAMHPASIRAIATRATARAFIESAAAEADAWAKIEAFCVAHELCGPVLYADDGAWWVQITNEYHEQLTTVQAPTRLAALQLAAAWCEKEGA